MKREYRLTNSAARKLDQEQLFQELKECFSEKNRREPSEAESEGLREAAMWIKGNEANWRAFERGIEDETWNPADGARAIFSTA
jgi:hypothetical protein